MQTRKEMPIRQEYILLFMSDTHSEQPGQQLTHNWGRTAAFGEQSLQEGRLQRSLYPVYRQPEAVLALYADLRGQSVRKDPASEVQAYV